MGHLRILIVVSKLVLAAMSKLLLVTTSNHGNVDLLVLLPLGSVAAERTVADMTPVTLLRPGELHRGPEIVHAEATIVATPSIVVRMGMELLQPLRLGNKHQPILLQARRLVDIPATLHLGMAEVIKAVWGHLLVLLRHLD